MKKIKDVKMSYWTKTYGEKTYERIYINASELNFGDKLYLERVGNGGVHTIEWMPKLKSDWMPAYHHTVVNGSSTDIAFAILARYFDKLSDLFNDFKTMCK